MDATNVMLDLMKETRERFGFVADELNIGGGPGVTYINEERPPYSYYYTPVLQRIEEWCKAEDYEMPAVICEPGRSIVAEAGLQLYTVGMTKVVTGIRKYAAIDGGMPDNIRPALYGAKYKGIVANRADEEPTETVTICGKCCEGDSDMIIRDSKFADPKTGDIIAVFSTGAYGYPVTQAAIKAKKGESAAAIAEYVEDWVKHCTIFFAPYTLKFARKSGRIPSAAAFAGELMGLRPIMRIQDNEITTNSKVRGDKNIIPEIVKLTCNEMIPQTPYGIVYGSDSGLADELSAALTKKIGYPPVERYQIGAAIAINAGPRIIGSIFRRK
jgi:hypothetical protein